MNDGARRRSRRGSAQPTRPSAAARPQPTQPPSSPAQHSVPQRAQHPRPPVPGAPVGGAAQGAPARGVPVQGAPAQRAAAQRATARRAAERRAAGRPASAQRSEIGRVSAALARSRAWARPAGLGARLAAYSIDAAVCFILAVAAWLLTGSLLVGGLVLAEAAIILLVVEARTGATVGNLALRQRTARDDAPYSPGMARGLVRGLVQGAGSLAAFIGGWVVVATSAADPERMGRSLADRAGRTLVVKVPSAAERELWSRNAEAWALQAPVRPVDAPPGPGTMAGAGGHTPEAAMLAHQQAVAPQAQLAHVGGAPIAQPTPPVTAPRAPAAATVASAAAPPLPPGVVAVDAPVAAAPAPREVGTLLLLNFDTGQRAQLRIPTVVNLGRRPEASDPEDQLVVVEDPDGSVSKTHLRLEYRGDSVWVSDLGSTNGSEMVDDTGATSALVRGARVRLEDGASVRMGQRSFTVATITGEL